MSTVKFDEIFAKVPSWTSINERQEVAKLASQVPADGTIVEIGALYGGMTIVLGQANPEAHITVIDNFSWSPIPERPASQAELLKNTLEFGIKPVVYNGDSRVIGKTWDKRIDLLWIDGGHSYDYVRQDLENFGPYAEVIALHDWDNPAWPDIRRAVEDYIGKHPGWRVDHNVEMVVVLRKAA